MPSPVIVMTVAINRVMNIFLFISAVNTPQSAGSASERDNLPRTPKARTGDQVIQRRIFIKPKCNPIETEPGKIGLNLSFSSSKKGNLQSSDLLHKTSQLDKEVLRMDEKELSRVASGIKGDAGSKTTFGPNDCLL